MNLIVESVERIAVLRATALGDLLLILPAVEALRRAYPAARITLLGKEWQVPFLRGRPGPVDDVVPVPPMEESLDPPPELVGRFDLALQMNGDGHHANAFVNGLGARVTAGLRGDDAQPLDRWVPYVPYQHETLRFLEVAGLVGASSDDVEPRMRVTRDDYAELRSVLGQLPRGLIAVHPGGRDARRRWPAACFAEAAARLGRPVAVTGGDHERDLVEKVAALIPRSIPVVGALSAGGLAALYTACDVVIANDSGPRRLAAATGTPTVGVYWCGDLINAGPLTRSHHRPLISWTTQCPTCGGAGLREPGGCDHPVSWLTDVGADAVAAQADELLNA
ncbi:glycosyltransferase family 9 protein [Herbidospora sp. NEAU-GS84]|uniref:Glycosyltransferase family 9 protein n=1 Tax=Herbidospora solisilvae TaxID=2696284 RepID=A0A7C9J576_9ACTN|nr:glycosyltransferase family 9 protein [Herbidospora solisilvae]NAS24825.1 glycosyltransferase family 9 protein [Herbidospora solisilvae]